jgi:hypothetical protein
MSSLARPSILDSRERAIVCDSPPRVVHEIGKCVRFDAGEGDADPAPLAPDAGVWNVGFGIGFDQDARVLRFESHGHLVRMRKTGEDLVANPNIDGVQMALLLHARQR